MSKYKKMRLRISPSFILNELLKDYEDDNDYNDIIITDVVRGSDEYICVDAVLVDEKVNESLNRYCERCIVI